jgi:hypothetical protein
MLKEVILKSHDSAVNRRDLSALDVFVQNEESSFVEVETFVTLPE